MYNESYEDLLKAHADAKARMKKGIVFTAVACGIATVASCFSVIPVVALVFYIISLPFYGVGIPFLITGIVRRVKANNRINAYKVMDSMPTIVGKDSNYHTL